VVITGAQFAAGSTVVVSGKGVTVSTVTVVSATTIDATFKVASTAALGLRNVSVTDTDGTGTCSNCLSIDVAPSLTGASPSGVAAGAAGQVTFTGTNFVAGSVSVSFVEAGTAVKATAVTVVSASTITAKVTVGATATLGAYEVKVTNPDGGVGTCDACFSIIAPPTVTGLSTPSVAPGSTTSETITGTGFVAGATVKGPNTKVTFSNVTVVNSTTITATMTVVVGAAPGTGLDVTVTDPAAGGYGVGSGAVLTVT
jgi:hypothetical protein